MAGKKDEKKLRAFLATFLSIVGFILALILWRKDDYVIFYAKQSLVIFVVGVFAGLLKLIFAILPIMGTIITFALNAIIIIAWALSWIYALSGETIEVPIVGKWGNSINI